LPAAWVCREKCSDAFLNGRYSLSGFLVDSEFDTIDGPAFLFRGNGSGNWAATKAL
jgi:hypothetical protein